jgi:hypothetical protein
MDASVPERCIQVLDRGRHETAAQEDSIGAVSAPRSAEKSLDPP